MMNNEDQGSYQGSELQWVCPDCEAVNTQDSCAICGCPRPGKEPEKEDQGSAGDQGRFDQSVQEWICPDCETRNTARTCTVCGRPRPEAKKKRVPPKAAITAGAAAAIGLCLLAGIVFGLPYLRYRNACGLLQSGEYERAYQAFSAIPDYRDSAALRSQAIVQWADRLEKAGAYDEAIQTLTYLPADEASTEMKKELCLQWARELQEAEEYALAQKMLEPVSALEGISTKMTELRYYEARWLLEDENDYAQAFRKFTDLGNYQDAGLYASQAAEQWIYSVLDEPDVGEAARIWGAVELTFSQSQRVYQELCARELYTYDDDGRSWTYNNDDLAVRRLLLEMLPDRACPNKAELNTLLAELDVDLPGLFVQEHRDVLETLWDTPLVQSIVRNDLCIDEWLLGTWRTENRGYYMIFTESDSGGYDASYNVPWVDMPDGAKYYYISNLIFSWANEDNDLLEDVYRFTLLEANKIEVYAYKNEKTYTMFRN